MRLVVENLFGGYGRIEVLKGISFTTEGGGALGIFGPNGHGKTTLLKTISALLRPRSGRVEFDSLDLAKASAHEIVEAGLVHVPQGNTLFPRMTVSEALTLGAYTARAWSEHRRTIDQVYSLFPRLAERRNQYCQTLSGGERQMASIGVGLMGLPRLLMLDEPTLGLAPKVRKELAKKIKEIANSSVKLVVIDQDVDLLLGLCDRLLLIENGTVGLDIADKSTLAHQDVLDRYFGGSH
jgi:branched-chain amino acid transport system ATP-binding protein